jgi:hypothetical protein
VGLGRDQVEQIADDCGVERAARGECGHGCVLTARPCTRHSARGLTLRGKRATVRA